MKQDLLECLWYQNSVVMYLALRGLADPYELSSADVLVVVVVYGLYKCTHIRFCRFSIIYVFCFKSVSQHDFVSMTSIALPDSLCKFQARPTYITMKRHHEVPS